MISHLEVTHKTSFTIVQKTKPTKERPIKSITVQKARNALSILSITTHFRYDKAQRETDNR